MYSDKIYEVSKRGSWAGSKIVLRRQWEGQGTLDVLVCSVYRSPRRSYLCGLEELPAWTKLESVEAAVETGPRLRGRWTGLGLWRQVGFPGLGGGWREEVQGRSPGPSDG